MAEIKIKTAKKVIPMIYAYAQPGVTYHEGWTKIGYAEKQAVEKRMHQQMHTADIVWEEKWRGMAVFDDGSGESFLDTDFHRYLRKHGIEQKPKKEWFHIDGPSSHQKFNEFRVNRGVLESLTDPTPYDLREEQERAVKQTKDYHKLHEQGEFLWNAKPRFGKTLSAYEFCKMINARNVLIITNRPAIANSWYSDYEKFIGTQSGYYFVSNTDALKEKRCVVSREDFRNVLRKNDDDNIKCIEFVSLQDLKGSRYFSPHSTVDKLEEVADINWDVLVIDEAHEGVDTYKTDVVLDHIKRKFTLHLSGTPFKALANEKFPEQAIFNWTYREEQEKKRNWDYSSGEENPYAELPQLNLFTYQMSEIIKEEVKEGIEIEGKKEEFAFDLNSFFEVKNDVFVLDKSVDRFLDALTTQTKFPFSTEELREELRHTFWLLNRVDSAKALAKKLEKHPVFCEYKIILAAGDGKLDDDEEMQKSYDKVTQAIKQYDKTITLSVGQLTTGITIPEWTAVLILSNIKSPALYMQAAFRAQNPCLFSKDGSFYRKENAYIFDFDPARTLEIFEEFANDLSADTANGKGDSERRKENVKILLNLFPVIGEDDNGEMIELDAEKLLTIPRKIRSKEVVKRGFMSNYLFQNISHIFAAPSEVLKLIQNISTAEDSSKKDVSSLAESAENVSVDENGEISLNNEHIIGKATDVFGDKLYDVAEVFDKTIKEINDNEQNEDNKMLEFLKAQFQTNAIKPIIEKVKEHYGSELKEKDKRRLERKIKTDAERIIEKQYRNYSIDKNRIELEKKEVLEKCDSEEEKQYFDEEYSILKEKTLQKFKENLSNSIDEFIHIAGQDTVREIERNKMEKEKTTIEDAIKNHLRGFSRTIPSFLMAYGSEDVTLENFDSIIPDEVFKEVTSISLDEFRKLRDGGMFLDEVTGEEKWFEGNIFNPVVFNDSVKEFMRLRKELSNYFDEANEKDIFDYIPPQKTNQIFTPKWVVKKMVDMLETENPGCFDDPDKTFADFYMKSGLYITEIVKRLYNSKKMKQLYPDDTERLQHIFTKQVYGCAPTEIIYRIAINYIFGFDEQLRFEQKNFRLADTAVLAQKGKLEKFVQETFAK